jgi:hypothetical protein
MSRKAGPEDAFRLQVRPLPSANSGFPGADSVLAKNFELLFSKAAILIALALIEIRC